MAKYIIKRVIAAILTIWVLITIVFFLVRLMPGDPFTSAKLTDEVRANMDCAVWNLYGESASWRFRLFHEIYK